jgi:2-polyprenyl-3-methyl-5-hydroxy-6-metoxy-1,4-benzoquinol methylase
MTTATRLALDRLGVLPTVYDVRARLGYLRSRELRARNRALAETARENGLPLPPPELVYTVAGHFDLSLFLRSGVDHARFIRERLQASGVVIERAAALLDFGCGCGRILRHWHQLESTRVYGSDANLKLVKWCNAALPFVHVAANGLEPPLRYETDAFDVVYAISVFTHLPETLQLPWIQELERVLSPGGHMLVTTKGLSRASAMTDAERERFDAGELVVQNDRYAGRNLCAAFHPEPYVRERLAGSLEVVEFVPADGAVLTQDATILRKR